MTNERIKAIGNLIIEVLLIINLVLTIAGKSPLPIDEERILEVVYSVLTGVQTLRVWWYNQNITPEADTAQKLIREMKDNKNVADGTGDPEEVEDDDR